MTTGKQASPPNFTEAFSALFERRIEEDFRVFDGVHQLFPGALPGAGSSTWRSLRLFAAPRKGAGSAPLVPLYRLSPCTIRKGGSSFEI